MYFFFFSFQNCNYKESDALKVCKCGSMKVNKECKHCLTVLNSHSECKTDCKLNTDFAKNETRVNSYCF